MGIRLPLNITRAERLQSLLWLIAAALLIAATTYVSQKFWRENGLRSLQEVNEQRVQLVANAVRAEIGRQDHLPVVLALDRDVRDALATPQDTDRLKKLDAKLKRLSQEADTRALYVTGPDGVVLASDDAESTDSLIGRPLGRRPYIVRAIADGSSQFLGVDPGTNLVRYYLAQAVHSDGALLGVAVVRIEFDQLEAAWANAGERVIVTDNEGIVFLASDPAYKYRTLKDGPGGLQFGAAPQAIRYPETGASPFAVTTLENRGRDRVVRIKAGDEQTSYLYQSMRLPEFGWTIHRLTDLSSIQADQRDGAIIGATISVLMISILLYLLQRHRVFLAAREAGDRLKREVAERTRELREVNASLHSEIDERRRTEARLRQTQNELVQAGKLAALGQMSAALAHEINQPLAAIRTFIASTKIFAGRGESAQVARNLDLINGLAERMASITSHLKTFARKSDHGKPEPVQVDRAVEGALFLISGQTKTAGVTVEKTIEPDLFVRGYAVQIEQILVNLVQNALDAVAGVKDPKITVTVKAQDDYVRITVADNGVGIAASALDQLFDPFFTTKSVGKGLGLGLSISYGIVQDFDGAIHASNRPDGGAELVVELPRLMPVNQASEKSIHA